jgi:hypothetical protein
MVANIIAHPNPCIKLKNTSISPEKEKAAMSDANVYKHIPPVKIFLRP